MKIAIARLRSGTSYVEPLNHIIDSFCECLKAFIKNHPEHEYLYYNFSWGKKPHRDVKAIKNADVIIIPSEAEFTYHIPGAIHTLDLAKSNEELDKIEPYFKGKTVIVLRSDRRDNEELYRDTLGYQWQYDEIDEIDFQNNIHSLKYYFIKEMSKLFDDISEKKYDFCYWGSDKRNGIDGKPSGDERHIILKEIYKNPDITSYFIGRFYGFERHQKMQKLRKIIPVISSARTTLCFNWMDSRATTSRYIEAVACGTIPLVWKDYDCTGIFVKDEWQRVRSVEELIDKVNGLRDNGIFEAKFKQIEESFLKNLKPKEEYLSDFDRVLTEKLSKVEIKR